MNCFPLISLIIPEEGQKLIADFLCVHLDNVALCKSLPGIVRGVDIAYDDRQGSVWRVPIHSDSLGENLVELYAQSIDYTMQIIEFCELELSKWNLSKFERD